MLRSTAVEWTERHTTEKWSLPDACAGVGHSFDTCVCCKLCCCCCWCWWHTHSRLALAKQQLFSIIIRGSVPSACQTIKIIKSQSKSKHRKKNNIFISLYVIALMRARLMRPIAWHCLVMGQATQRERHIFNIIQFREKSEPIDRSIVSTGYTKRRLSRMR